MGPVVLIALALAACGTEASTTEPQKPPPFADVTQLFDRAIAPTCSLNNGVCHNSNNYPDLHTVERLVETIGQPCNIELTDPVQIHDACEPPADHFVAGGIDARIVHAALLPAEAMLPAAQLTQVTLTFAAASAGLAVGETDTEIHRAGTVLAVGARVASITDATVVLDLRSVQSTAKQFFDIRVFPPGPLRLHVGDPNGNGIEGARTTPMTLVAAGDPDRSYLLRRLTDPAFGELMPRQCRTWSDDANRALACWIAGLDGDNALDPIDYAACAVDVAGLGKCQ